MEEKSSRFSKVRGSWFGEDNILLFSVGVDKLALSVQLDLESVVNLRKAIEGREYRPTAKYKKRFVVSSLDGQGKFIFSIRKSGDHSPYYLMVWFNPSLWMFKVGVKGSVQGKNFISGNLKAVQCSLEQLEQVLKKDVWIKKLRNKDGLPLFSFSFRLSQVHFARDMRLRRKGKKVVSGVCEANWAFDNLNFFLSSPPLFTRGYGHQSLSFYYTNPSSSHEVGKRIDPLNLFFERANYVALVRNDRRTVFYVKKRVEQQDDGEEVLVGASLLVEHRIISPAAIKKKLGTNSIDGLCALLLKEEQWHQSGRVDPVPVIENLLNEQIATWIQVGKGVQAIAVDFLNHEQNKGKKKEERTYVYPVITKDLLAFLPAIEMEQNHYRDEFLSKAFSCEWQALRKERDDARKAVLVAKRALTLCAQDSLDCWKQQAQVTLREILAEVAELKLKRFKQHGMKILKRFQEQQTEYLNSLVSGPDAFIIGTPLNAMTCERLLFLLNAAFEVLGPNRFYLTAGQVVGYLGADGNVIPTQSGDTKKRFERLKNLLSFVLDVHGGSFGEVPKLTERLIIADYLTMHQLGKRKFSIVNRKDSLAKNSLFHKLFFSKNPCSF